MPRVIAELASGFVAERDDFLEELGQLCGPRKILFTWAARPLAYVNLEQRLQERRLADPAIVGLFFDLRYELGCDAY
jgi:hypothetical protein